MTITILVISMREHVHFEGMVHEWGNFFMFCVMNWSTERLKTSSRTLLFQSLRRSKGPWPMDWWAIRASVGKATCGNVIWWQCGGSRTSNVTWICSGRSIDMSQIEGLGNGIGIVRYHLREIGCAHQSEADQTGRFSQKSITKVDSRGIRKQGEGASNMRNRAWYYTEGGKVNLYETTCNGLNLNLQLRVAHRGFYKS